MECCAPAGHGGEPGAVDGRARRPPMFFINRLIDNMDASAVKRGEGCVRLRACLACGISIK